MSQQDLIAAQAALHEKIERAKRKLAAMPPEPAPVQVPGAPGLSLAGPHGAGTAKASKAK